MASLRSILLMLFAPLLVLLVWAHLFPQIWFRAAEILAGFTGLVGVATSPWSKAEKLAAAAGYILLAVLAVPFLGLLAVCTTGDCL